MSQDKNANQGLSDSDEESSESSCSGKTDVSTVDVVTIDSDGTSRDVTDEDSSISCSGLMAEKRKKDEVKSTDLKYRSSSSSICPSAPTHQRSSQQVDDLSLSFKAAKQSDVHQEIKIPGTPTKRFRCLDEKVETEPYSKKPKSLLSTSNERYQKTRKCEETSKPLSLLLPDFFTTAKFEREFAKTESGETHQRTARSSCSSSGIYSHDYASPSPSKQTSATIMSPDAPKQVGVPEETKPPGTPTKRSYRTLGEKPVSQPDSKKRVPDTEQSPKGDQFKRSTFTKSNSPILPEVITTEKFEKEFARTEGKESKILKEQTNVETSISSASKSSPSLNTMIGSEGHKKMLLRRSQSEREGLDAKLDNTSTSKLGKSLSDIFQSPLSPVKLVRNPHNVDPQAGPSQSGTRDEPHRFRTDNRKVSSLGSEKEEKNPFLNSILAAQDPVRKSEKLSFNFDNLLETYKNETPVANPPVAIPPVAIPPVAIPPVAIPPVAIPPVAIPPVAIPPVAIPPVANQPVANPPVAFIPYTDRPVLSRTEFDVLVNQIFQENLNSRPVLISIRLSELESLVDDFRDRINDNQLLLSLGIPLPPNSTLTSPHSRSTSHSQVISSSPSCSNSQSSSSLDSSRNLVRNTHRRRVPEEFVEILRTFESALREMLDEIRYGLSVGNVPDSQRDLEKFMEKMDEMYERVLMKFKEFCWDYPNFDDICNRIQRSYRRFRRLFKDIAYDIQNWTEKDFRKF